MTIESKVFVCVYDEKFVYTGLRYPVQGHAIGQYLGGLEYPIVKRRFSTGIKAPKIDDIPLNVVIGGVPYELGVLGSTHAKDGCLYYVASVDAAKIKARFPITKAEDIVRMLRALLSDGTNYGAIHEEHMNIMIVAPGTVIDGIPYEDGSAAVADGWCPIKGKAIKLGSTSNNYTIFQHLDTEKVRPDILECAKRFKEDLEWKDQTHTVHRKNPDLHSSVVLSRVKGKSDDDSFKARYLKACPALAKHIWFSNGASSESSRLCLSQTYAPYLGAEDFLAIAYHCWTGPEGIWIGYRHPVISDGSVRAMECTGEELPADIVGGVVGTLTGFHPSGQWFTAKFAGVIRKLPEGVHMILCDKDLKIGKRLVKSDEPYIGEVDAVFTILQRYTRAACLGVPVEEGKKMNLDYDGDLVNRINASDIPNIYANVLEHQELNSNFKLDRKSDTDYTPRDAVRVELNAMGGSMGWATNLRSSWYSVGIAKRLEMLDHIYDDVVELAGLMKLEGTVLPMLQDVGGVLQYFIQYMIDSQKNLLCDTSVVYGAASKIQSGMSVITEKTAGWVVAARGMREGVAFVTSFPMWTYELPQETLDKALDDGKYRKQWQWKIHNPPACGDSVPAACFNANREYTRQVWEVCVVNPDPVGSRTFTNWVPTIPMQDAVYGVELCDMYLKHFQLFEKARADGDVNQYDTDDVTMYRRQWQDECIAFCNKNFGGDLMRGAIALWRTSCDDGSFKLAAAPFIGFPDQTMEIITGYASTPNAHRCVLVGVKELMNTLPPFLEGTCDIITSSGVTYMVPLEKIPGSRERCFGNMAEIESGDAKEGYSWPTAGHRFHYKLNIRRSGTAYDAVFEPLT
jgi:hypothetical protein